MEFWVYENWVRSKAIVHSASCSFCNYGSGLHGTNSTASSTWHGPFPDYLLAMTKAKGCSRNRTDSCSHCIG